MQQEDFYLRQIQKIGTLIAAMMNKRKEGFAQESLNLSSYIFKEFLPNQELEPPFVLDQVQLDTLTDEELTLLQKTAYETGKTYHTLGNKQYAADYLQVSLQISDFADKKSKTYNLERAEMRQRAINKIENA